MNQRADPQKCNWGGMHDAAACDLAAQTKHIIHKGRLTGTIRHFAARFEAHWIGRCRSTSPVQHRKLLHKPTRYIAAKTVPSPPRTVNSSLVAILLCLTLVAKISPGACPDSAGTATRLPQGGGFSQPAIYIHIYICIYTYICIMCTHACKIYIYLLV